MRTIMGRCAFLLLMPALTGCPANAYVRSASRTWENLRNPKEVLVAADGSVAVLLDAGYGHERLFGWTPGEHRRERYMVATRFEFEEVLKFHAGRRDRTRLAYEEFLENPEPVRTDYRFNGAPRDRDPFYYYLFYAAPERLEARDTARQAHGDDTELVAISQIPVNIIPRSYRPKISNEALGFGGATRFIPLDSEPDLELLPRWDIIPDGFDARNARPKDLPDSFRSDVRRYAADVPFPYETEEGVVLVDIAGFWLGETRERRNYLWYAMIPPAFVVDFFVWPFYFWGWAMTSSVPWPVIERGGPFEE